MIIIINYLIDSHYEHTTSTNREDLGSTIASSVRSIPVVLVVLPIAIAVIALLLVVTFAILLVRYRQKRMKKMNMQV